MPATSPKSAIVTTVEGPSADTPKKAKTLEKALEIAADDVGALANGGEVNIWEFKSVGFILQYFVIGFIYYGMPATIYGVFNGYLNVPGYVYSTAAVVVAMPWSFKFLFGLVNDLVPINGYRRKPYMVVGWLMCAVTLIYLSTLTLPEPYFCRDDAGEYIKQTANSTAAEPCNPSARDAGGEIAMLMCLAALGYVIADVAADGLLVQYAQREPMESRGKTQTNIYLVRTVGGALAYFIVGLCMNGKEYNGTFDWSISFNDFCAIMAAPATIMVPVSWFLVQEETVDEEAEKIAATAQQKGGGILEAGSDAPTTLRGYMKQGWELLSSKAFFCVVMYNFWDSVLRGISTTSGTFVKSEWAGVKQIQDQMFTVVSLLAFAGGLYVVKERCLNYSWRKMLAYTTIFLNLLDLLIVFLTTYNVVRNQYFYLGETILDTLPAAANFVVGTYIIVEMADVGNEGLTYGLLSSISNLGGPFARAIGNQVFGAWTHNLSDKQNYIDDKPEFRNAVALSFILSYGLSFLALGLLFLLPSQKPDAQERKRTWGKDPRCAYAVITLVGFALIYSVTQNFMVMSPSTACLEFAGGSGC
jgi:Na+/melibiose symporter-like transporter